MPVGRRGSAIASGYLAIGVWSLVDISRHGRHGKGRAWFAVAVGGVGTLLLILFVVDVATT